MGNKWSAVSIFFPRCIAFALYCGTLNCYSFFKLQSQGDSLHYFLESNQLLFLFVVLTPVTTSHFSGITYNSTATVGLSKTRYKVSFEEYHKLLRPSLTFSARVRRQHLSEMQSLSCTDNRYSSVNVKQLC